jgi:hypothetical protein
MKVIVALAQLIHQMLQMGWQHGFRTQILLQPFTDAVADRPQGLAIDLFVFVVDSAVHSEFLRRAFEAFMQGQVVRTSIVSSHRRIHNVPVRHRQQVPENRTKKSPGAMAGA